MKSSNDIFVCDGNYTSKRMLKMVGAFSKDPAPDMFITVAACCFSMLALMLAYALSM
ncbi:hypothetical protein KSP39_PZI016293 [Platanthera zijinensis]|uniref:Uncharacterized protein n=1 Tax=Platanthera zijinensis TaxID=2320716 RepID=A0AAP0G092_9ASPA